MSRHVVLGLMIEGPAGILAITWIGVLVTWKRTRPSKLMLVALAITSVAAAWAMPAYILYDSQTYDLPPWKDPETLDLGLLFLMAPVSAILAAVAAVRGAPKWLVAAVEIASIQLAFIGFMACGSV